MTITELVLENQKLKQELDEARENLDQEMKFHHRTHSELIQTQCKLLDIEMKCDAWQEIAEHLHHLVQHPAYGVDQAIQRMDVLEAYKHLKHGH